VAKKKIREKSGRIYRKGECVFREHRLLFIREKKKKLSEAWLSCEGSREKEKPFVRKERKLW